MLDDLEQRTREDIHSIEQGVTSQAANVKHQAEEKLEAIERRIPGTDTVGQQLRAHPLSSVVLGFGAGIALGVASEGPGDGRSRGARDRQETRPRSASSWRGDRLESQDGGAFAGLLDALTGPALSAVMPALQDEFRTLVRQSIAGFFGSDRPSGPRSTVDREDRSERRVRRRERVGVEPSPHNVGVLREHAQNE
jgi:hypothetical protein